MCCFISKPERLRLHLGRKCQTSHFSPLPKLEVKNVRVDFTSWTYDQTSYILLTGRFSAVWEMECGCRKVHEQNIKAYTDYCRPASMMYKCYFARDLCCAATEPVEVPARVPVRRSRRRRRRRKNPRPHPASFIRWSQWNSTCRRRRRWCGRRRGRERTRRPPRRSRNRIISRRIKPARRTQLREEEMGSSTFRRYRPTTLTSRLSTMSHSSSSSSSRSKLQSRTSTSIITPAVPLDIGCYINLPARFQVVPVVQIGLAPVIAVTL